MKLTGIEIKNYRALEHVNLQDFSKTNVLIGRNNSGKSSVFGAMKILVQVLNSQGMPSWERILTSRDATRSLEICILFTPTDIEREEYIDMIIAAGHVVDTKEALLDSALLRKIEFYYKSTQGNPAMLHLRTTRILSMDNQWSVIQKLTANENDINPTSDVIVLENLAADNRANFSVGQIDVTSSRFRTSAHLHVNQHTGHSGELSQWPYKKLREFFNKSFFFDPFRHSAEALGVNETPKLDQNGANLATVLMTTLSNNRPKFDEISAFMKSALPDIGLLQTPLAGQNTGIGFLVEGSDYRIPLFDMGGGVEQLLMVATVLITTPEDYTIFLEEPESHLHAGAQRFLIERLTQGNRQVFLTTHSPTFINNTNEKSMYQVTYTGRKSVINRVKDAIELEETLQDIGARNSDVLLSDAVLFVEGPGDRDGLTEMGRKIGQNFEEHNITLLPMGGGDVPERGLPMRSDLLEGISKKSPVPHLFILDRDERPTVDIKKVEKLLGDKIYFWEAREFENYLLVPHALLSTLKIKCQNNATALAKVNAETIDGIQKLIVSEADKLYGLILVKRIRNRLGGLPEGLLRRNTMDELAKHATDKNLANLITANITTRFEKHLQSLKIEKVVDEERKELNRKWAKQKSRLSLAPGAEILNQVFAHFDAKYNKPSDTLLIAQQLAAQDIPQEVVQIINKPIALGKR